MSNRFRWRNFPLPEPHLGGLAAGLILYALVPWRLPVPLWGRIAGIAMVFAGLALALWAVRAAVLTPLHRPDRLVIQGPWRASRNPMYIAWTAAYLGACLAFVNAWLLVLLPAVVGVTHLVVLREERELAARFGDEYQQYAATVGRYL